MKDSIHTHRREKADDILYRASKDQGWNSDTELLIVLDFIDERDLGLSFKTWLRCRKQIEDNLDELIGKDKEVTDRKRIETNKEVDDGT